MLKFVTLYIVLVAISANTILFTIETSVLSALAAAGMSAGLKTAAVAAHHKAWHYVNSKWAKA